MQSFVVVMKNRWKPYHKSKDHEHDQDQVSPVFRSIGWQHLVIEWMDEITEAPTLHTKSFLLPNR